MADILQYADAAFDTFRRFTQEDKSEQLPVTPAAGQFREKNDILFLSLHPNKRVVEKPSVRPHTHSYAELVYVHKGSLFQRVNGQQLDMREGSLMLLGSGAVHQPWVDTADDIVVNLGVRFDTLRQLLARFNTVESSALAKLGGLLPDSKPGSGSSALFIANSPMLSALVNEMFCEFLSEDAWAEHVLMNDLVRLIVEFCRQDAERTPQQSAEYDDPEALLPAIRAYIERHFSDLTMEQLSVHFSYSERQMRRLLRKISDDGLPGMLNRLRIERACEYMARGDISLDELCSRVGFNDSAYFSKVFKDITGLSLRDFRCQLAVEG